MLKFKLGIYSRCTKWVAFSAHEIVILVALCTSRTDGGEGCPGFTVWGTRCSLGGQSKLMLPHPFGQQLSSDDNKAWGRQLRKDTFSFPCFSMRDFSLGTRPPWAWTLICYAWQQRKLKSGVKNSTTRSWACHYNSLPTLYQAKKDRTMLDSKSRQLLVAYFRCWWMRYSPFNTDKPLKKSALKKDAITHWEVQYIKVQRTNFVLLWSNLHKICWFWISFERFVLFWGKLTSLV